jgi:hypothetical protein
MCVVLLGGPMIVCVGPVGVPRTLRRKPVPDVERAHPVETMPPVVKVPSPFTVTSWPELELKVPVFWPVLTWKKRSLRFWATLLGSACRFTRNTVIESVPVVKPTVAETGWPPAMLPAGV